MTAPRGIHYAWVVLATSLLGMAFSQGLRLAFGAFVPAWEDDFGTNRAVLSGIAGVVYLVYGLGQPTAGRLSDRLGARRVLALGLVVSGTGALVSALASSPLALLAGFGAVGALGYAATSSTIPASLAIRWFAGHRGLALGLTGSAIAVGQLVLTPVTLLAIEAIGWRPTLLAYAAVLVLGLAPLAWWLVRSAPADLGLRPFGWEGGAAGGGRRFALRGPADVPARTFWMVAVPYFVCGLTTSGLVDTHLVPLAHDHAVPTGVIAGAAGALGVANIGGALFSGWLSDRVPRGSLLGTIYLLRALSLVLLVNLSAPAILVVFALLFGIVDYSTLAPTQSLGTEYFGRRFGTATVIGVFSLGHQLGSSAGAVLAGVIRQITGSYDLMLVIAMALLVGAAGLCFTLPRERRVPVAARLASTDP